MTRVQKILSVLSLMLIVVLFIKSRPMSISSYSGTDQLKSSAVHESYMYDDSFFKQAEELAGVYSQKSTLQVYGGILPHHLLAAPLITAFFHNLPIQEYKTVVLLSPNHFNVGPYMIASSVGHWRTVYGELETNGDEISFLERTGVVGIYDELFSREHGIYGLIPFIKKTFPDTKFIPLTLKAGTPHEECDRLAAALFEISNRSTTLLLVSSDFSHYLPSDEADTYDKETIKAIRDFNFDKVFSLDHEKNSDSPESLYVLLKVMELLNFKDTQLLINTNSAKMTHQPELTSTTSYVTMYFGTK